MSAKDGEVMSPITIGASLAAAAVALAAAVLVLVVPAGAASGQVGLGFNAPLAHISDSGSLQGGLPCRAREPDPA
jgi:hypothetical protein